MKKEIICTVCPLGCNINAEGNETEITIINGYACKRGLEYGTNEFLHPVRILTTTVKIKGEQDRLIPVRSEEPLPKEKIMECMEVIKKQEAELPVQMYDVIIPNICNSGINIVATGELN